MTGSVDVVVIGSGMIGAATARHLVEAGVTTALIGAVEPNDYSTASGPFASHWDEGRVTRIAAFSPQWAELAAQSIRRYGDIATRSGVRFHTPVGLAFVAPDADTAGRHGEALGADIRSMSAVELLGRTGISVPRDHRIVYEGPPAGLINPRAMVVAQRRLVERAGGRLIDGVVETVRPRSTGVDVHVAGTRIQAGTVVLATGAHGAELVGIELDIERRLHTIVRADVGPGPLPSLILHEPDHDGLSGVYWVPPVGYPNGRTLLKIGGTTVPIEVADTSSRITAWFNAGGSVAAAGSLLESMRQLLPGRSIGWNDHQPCVLTYTPTDLPYIGFVDERVVVASGGCGAAAKSGDELGRLAASVAAGTDWPNPRLPAGLFAPRVR